MAKFSSKIGIPLTIDAVPESYNNIKNWHYMEKDAYNNLWYDLVSYAYRRLLLNKKVNLYKDNYLGTPFKKAKISFYIYFKKDEGRDKINFAAGLKPALDALTNRICGIIVDDKWADVDDQYFQLFDKENPRTEIIIMEDNYERENSS